MTRRECQPFASLPNHCLRGAIRFELRPDACCCLVGGTGWRRGMAAAGLGRPQRLTSTSRMSLASCRVSFIGPSDHRPTGHDQSPCCRGSWHLPRYALCRWNLDGVQRAAGGRQSCCSCWAVLRRVPPSSLALGCPRQSRSGDLICAIRLWCCPAVTGLPASPQDIVCLNTALPQTDE